MSDQDPLAQSVAAMGRFYLGEATLEEALQHVTELVAVAVPPVAYAGVSMLVEGKPITSVFTDPDVLEIDQAQYDADDGPCLDAFRHGQVYGIPSTERDDRWREFSRAAFAHGIRSTLSLPLTVSDRSLGALNLYSEQENAFSERDHQAADVFAVQAAALLANTQAHIDARSLGEQLGEAMKSRAVIEQAKGILIERHKLTADQAFRLLADASMHTNRKLRAVAEDLVLTGELNL